MSRPKGAKNVKGASSGIRGYCYICRRYRIIENMDKALMPFKGDRNRHKEVYFCKEDCRDNIKPKKSKNEKNGDDRSSDNGISN